MCQAVLFYYPKVEVATCTSQSEFYDFMKGIGVDGVSGEVLKTIGMPYDPKGSELSPADVSRSLEEAGDGASYRSVFDRIMVTEPKDLQGISVGEHLREIDWTNNTVAKSIQDYWKTGRHYQFCVSSSSKRVPLKVIFTC
jgi:hypothetical protein